MLDIVKAMLLGIIEGITEWFPVSSEAHLYIADAFLKLDLDNAFRELFPVSLKLGAIIAVIVIYWHKLWPFTADKTKKFIKPKSAKLWLKIILSILPAVVTEMIFDETIDRYLHTPEVMASLLIIYGVLFVFIELTANKRKISIHGLGDISYKTAVFIGLFGVMSVVPGTSRIGAYIVGALLLGASRTVAAEYAFFTALPVMAGTGIVRIARYINSIAESTALGFSDCAVQFIVLGVGMVSAFLTSVMAIKLISDYVKKSSFLPFGIYRIIPAAAIILLAVI